MHFKKKIKNIRLADADSLVKNFKKIDGMYFKVILERIDDVTRSALVRSNR